MTYLVLNTTDKRKLRELIIARLGVDYEDLINNKEKYSLDFALIRPEKKSIGVEQIREELGVLDRKPTTLKRRLFLIEEAEKLTLQAQNALLKRLEEHSEQTDIILLSNSPSLLLDTIRSRAIYIEDISLRNNYETVNNGSSKKLEIREIESYINSVYVANKEQKDSLEELFYTICRDIEYKVKVNLDYLYMRSVYNEMVNAKQRIKGGSTVKNTMIVMLINIRNILIEQPNNLSSASRP